MSFRSSLTAGAARIAACLEAETARFDSVVGDGMRYATNGGKRLRGFLVLETARLHGINARQAVYAAAAIECLHAYSLVHDDLPAMDDDDLRRGQPTVHVKWDDATAILVGDALQTFAFELLTDPRMTQDKGVALTLVRSLAQASGAEGMVLGQALDIAAETSAQPLTLAQITHLQAGKTGALIRWSAEAGAVLGRADPAPLRRYAEALGLAFQIADDILDVTGDAKKAGKRLQKDAEAGKATFVSLLGLDSARYRAATLVEAAQDALIPYGTEAETLRDLARFVIARDT
ncbi:MAG: farnesyl diphosphate synthase [Pseudomonadota bacterium]